MEEFQDWKLEENPEEWITHLEGLQKRMLKAKKDVAPLNKALLIHILNNLPSRYEGIVDEGERNLKKLMLDLNILVEL